MSYDEWLPGHVTSFCSLAAAMSSASVSNIIFKLLNEVFVSTLTNNILSTPLGVGHLFWGGPAWRRGQNSKFCFLEVPSPQQ